MDPLTHTLVGAALARTRLGRATPLSGAALVVGANLPDVDVLSFLAGTDAALGFRRGWTHGPLAWVVLPGAWTLLLLAYDRWRRQRSPGAPPARPQALLGLTLLACLTHPPLDWLNTYGVRLLMPFDPRWFYGDAMFIIDPWVWLLLGGAVFLGRDGERFPVAWVLLAASASLPILLATELVPLGARLAWLVGLAGIALIDRSIDRAQWARWVATTSIFLTGAYILFLVFATTSATTWARGELARQGVADVQRLMVGPAPANPFRWEVVAETSVSYRHGSLGWLPARALELDPVPIERIARSPIVDAALSAPQVRGAVGWMRFPFVEIEPTAEGYTVHVLDARYVRGPRRSGFGTAVVRLDRHLRPSLRARATAPPSASGSSGRP